MNRVRTHTLRTRSSKTLRSEGKGQIMKSSEKQFFTIFLLVAFSFFILVTPFYALNIYRMLINHTDSPKRIADFYLFYHVMHKMYYTNNAINFFLYVISGQKFKTDLVKLLRCNRKSPIEVSVDLSDSNTKFTSIDV